METDKPKVEVTKDGPYVVTGNVSLAKGIMQPDETGIPYSWEAGEKLNAEDPLYLCRCGNSKHKPFCDDTHLTIAFDGKETAGQKKFDELATVIDGPALTLKDARVFCASARFCTRKGSIRKLIENSDDAASRDTAIRETLNCSSGRLVVLDKKTGQAIGENTSPSIIVAEDPGKGVSGPLCLKGGIVVFSSDGLPYEIRSRITLCRCGKSGNKPFCDGSHIKAGFDNGDPSINR